jgi:hypothetical protein
MEKWMNAAIAMFLWDPTDDSLGWWWSYPLSWGHCSAVFQLSVVWFISMVLISFSPQHAHILISSWCRSSLKDSVHLMVLSWAKWTFVLPLYIFVWTITTSSSPRHHKWCWGDLKCTWVQLGESLKSGDRGAECLAREGEDRGGAKHGYGDITGPSP